MTQTKDVSRLLDLATRARRLAPYFDDEDDRRRLLKHAQELEEAAQKLANDKKAE